MNQMIRHTWTPSKEFENVTVLICQRRTVDVTRLCIESLRRFYPTISILVVDGDSKDDSRDYLMVKQALDPNFKVQTVTGERHSHGEIMHHALCHWITTEKVILMDSDIVMMKAGLIELMVATDCYACGTVMEMGIKAEGCGPAENEEDTVLYAHPSLSMINRDMYLDMEPFKDHGAPCIANMIDAKEKGYRVIDLPIENYSLHLSGSSWTAPRTVWWHDNDVIARPLLSILTREKVPPMEDTEIIYVPNREKVHDSIITWDMKPKSDYNVSLFNVRFLVRGEYVVVGQPVCTISELREQVIATNGTDVIEIGVDVFFRRKYWQRMVVSVPDRIEGD